MAALIEAAARPRFPARIALVLSNVPDAPALERAARAGIPAEGFDHRTFDSREAFDRALHERLERAGIRLVCLAGYMRLLSPGFVAAWEGRLLNIHPSLLPSFRGLDTHARALAAGVRLHGATVHFVTDDLDAGPIVAQAAVPVLDEDTAEALAARVLAAEHRLYPLALDLVASGEARLQGDRVVMRRSVHAPAALFSPDLDR